MKKIDKFVIGTLVLALMAGMMPVDVEARFPFKGVILRKGTMKDIPGIQKMMMHIFKEYPKSKGLLKYYKDDPKAVLKEYKGADPKRHFVHIVEDRRTHQVVGVAALNAKPDPSPGYRNVGEITKVYLYKKYRRRGIAKWLVADLILRAQEMGFKNLYLTTRHEWLEAQSLYRSMGFRKIKQMRYISTPKRRYRNTLEMMLPLNR